MADPEQETVPARLQSPSEAIVSLTEAIGEEHLTDGETPSAGGWPPPLRRKRPSPLSRGGTDCWARCIVSAIGSLNRLIEQ